MTGQFISIGRFLHQNVGPFGFFFIGSSLHWSDLTGSWLGSGPDQLRSCVWRVLGHSLGFERDKRLFCSFFFLLFDWIKSFGGAAGDVVDVVCLRPSVCVCGGCAAGCAAGCAGNWIRSLIDARSERVRNRPPPFCSPSSPTCRVHDVDFGHGGNAVGPSVDTSGVWSAKLVTVPPSGGSFCFSFLFFDRTWWMGDHHVHRQQQ